MAKDSPITIADNWLRWEHKFIGVTCVDATGNPADLTGLALVWELVQSRGDTVALLSKTTAGGQITLIGNSLAKIEILHADYASLPGGTYFYTLWDKDDELVIAFGDAVLQEAGPSV